MNAETARMEDPVQAAAWRRWGPYLAERAWGTVREDYSADGNAWDYFPHDMARSRAYRWSEDGIGGVCDQQQTLCAAFAFWNGHDPILKERMFGLNNHEGNHGEDVKEYYFYVDNTPSHSYMKMVYRYPHAEFPYRQLVEINRHRTAEQPEYELLDTGVLDRNAFFDIHLEYAKADPERLYMRVRVANCGMSPARLHVLPTLWFRNTWAWTSPPGQEPVIKALPPADLAVAGLVAQHPEFETRYFYARQAAETIFTFNETNRQRLYNAANTHPAVKDAFHEYIIQQNAQAVHDRPLGTKAAFVYVLNLPPGGQQTIQLTLSAKPEAQPFRDFDEVFKARRAEADEYYAQITPVATPDDARQVQRQALAGMLWSKQFYNYSVAQWLEGDGDYPAPRQRLTGRNWNWKGLVARNVISMPDKWEYPWFAAWDWGFHCLTLSYVDIGFAKNQLELLVSERYQNLSGQVPAYEWNFSDVNPPVHALATWRVYNMEKRRRGGKGDRAFLERMYHKLLINFVWWVNRKDRQDRNVFEGGFLGLDNISIFDRSQPLPAGHFLQQADATGWMGLFCLNMMTIGLELAQEDYVYEHLAIKFFEHFIAIASAINASDRRATSLWDEQDGFYYDSLATSNHAVQQSVPLRVRSAVGLIPLYAVQILEKAWFDKLRAFRERYDWYMHHRADLVGGIGSVWSSDGQRCLLSIASQYRISRVLRYVADESEFLSPHGLRSVSKYHLDHPYRFMLGDRQYSIDYEPAESRSALFGGNSNWRGPVWFPLNYLLITALRTYHRFYGDQLALEYPHGSGQQKNLLQVSEDLARRLIAIFTPDQNGRRPVFGGQRAFQQNPLWQDLLPFNEYFNGDDGAGLGASHQTGWTGLVVQLIDYSWRGFERTGG